MFDPDHNWALTVSLTQSYTAIITPFDPVVASKFN